MIASCGEALVDLVPEPTAGGGPMNVAITAARLGSPAAFVGRVSTDQYGGMLWQHMVDNGVDLRAAERGPEPTATARVDPGPPVRFYFSGDGSADQALTEADLSALGPEPVVVHGGTLGLFRGHTAEVLATLAESASGLVSLDPNVRPQLIRDRPRWDHFHSRWASRAHVYKASDEDLDWIFPGRASSAVAAELLADRAELVAVTAGADGVVIYTDQHEVGIPGQEVEVVDTVGAGDSFVGSLLVSLAELGAAAEPRLVAQLERLVIEEIGSRAVACAGLTCSRVGADPPTRAELDTALSD